MGIIFAITYPSRNEKLNYNFTLIIFGIWIYFAGLVAGIISIMLSLFARSLNFKSKFIYNFIGILNICLGILGIVLALLNVLDPINVIFVAASFIIGFFIMRDIYINNARVA